MKTVFMSGQSNASGQRIGGAPASLCDPLVKVWNNQDLWLANGTANSLNGYLRQVRISKAAVWTSNFTLPSAPYF